MISSAMLDTLLSSASSARFKRNLRLCAAMASAVATLSLLSCTSSTVLVADDAVAVLAQPSPLGYPSSNPIPNSTLATLSKGQRVKITDTRYMKDFMYHEVILADGRRGYVIYKAGSFHVEK